MRLAPFIQSRDDVDEMFDRFFGPSASRPASYDVPTDVFHTSDALVIRMDLPGVEPNAVEVAVQDNVLLINGSRPFPYADDKVRFVRRGTFYGDFTQRVMLGKGLNVDAVVARFDKGVLEVRIPYAEEVQPRKISIEVGNDQAQLSK